MKKKNTHLLLSTLQLAGTLLIVVPTLGLSKSPNTLNTIISKEETAIYTEARKAKDFDVALALYDKLVALNKARYIGERGRFKEEHGNFEDALSDYNEAVLTEPRLWLLYRARYYQKNNQVDKALQDCQALIDLRQADLEKSQSNERASISAHKSLANAFWFQGSILESLGKMELATREFKKASDLDSAYIPIYSDFCKRNKLEAEYLASLNRLVEILPVKYLGRRADFYASHSKPESALKDYSELVKLSPKFSPKGGYSPLAWALMIRSEFYKDQNQPVLSAADGKRAKKLEAAQKKLFGFSAWPAR